MANLSNETIQRLYKERPSKKQIEAGVRHQNRLLYHTVTAVSVDDLSPYHAEYVNWITNNKPPLLPKDKVKRFKQLITIPLPTIELTESIFSNLNSVFKGQDAFLRYDFTDPEKLTDWESFRDAKFWETHGFEAMVNAIDSVWVVNLPELQESEFPEPKDMLINISDIIDISCDQDNECEYVIFKAGDKVFVYDEYKFMRYGYIKGEISKQPEIEIAHGLGYTPARMFWTDRLMRGNNINKKAPLTNVLGDLDWLLTCQTFKKYMEIANSYPILATYSAADDYQDSRQEGDRGTKKEDRDTDGGAFIGPGSIVTSPPPLAGEPDTMQHPAQYINPDVTTLEFHVGDLTLKRDNIFYSVVGAGGEQTNDAAKNEKQVMASFESRTAILLNIAKNFQLIHTFADKCKIELRYGKNTLKGISIDYGTKFFLKTSADLIEELNTAKENGSHASVIVAIMDEVIESKYRNDTSGLSRAKIIQELDPLPDKTQDESLTIFEKGGITKAQYVIKSQLLNFVNRFEREQASLIEFGSQIDFKLKIQSIYEELEKYAQEVITGKKLINGEVPVDLTEDVAKTALNGAQVSSLIEVVNNVVSGFLSKESAKVVLQSAFPSFTPEQVNGIIDNLIIDTTKQIPAKKPEVFTKIENNE